jgi:hypothetical protein
MQGVGGVPGEASLHQPRQTGEETRGLQGLGLAPGDCADDKGLGLALGNFLGSWHGQIVKGLLVLLKSKAGR